MKKITLVIVHWNTPDSLSKLLSRVSDSSLDIIVVDNNSDTSLSNIKNTYRQVRFIENDHNRGYAAACNQGAAHANGDWILFLNPDVDITPQKITDIQDYAQEQNLDACSPEPSSKDYKKPIPSILSLLREFTKLSLIIPPLPTQHTLFGGGLMIKKEVLMSIGGWDERFFLWFEDSDLSKRLIDHGYSIGWAPVEIGHSGGETFTLLKDDMKKGIFFTSMYAYADKHFGSFGKYIINTLVHHYTSVHLPLIENCSVSLVVPNMEEAQLDFFLKNNKEAIKEIDDVIIVSSSIEDQDVWKYRHTYPRVRFIPIKTNNGFTHTVNLGMRASTGKWVGTLNDDTIIPSKNWTDDMIKKTESVEHVGSLNPKIESPKGIVESFGVSVLKHGKAKPLVKKTSNTPFEVDASNAAAVLYARKALQKVGLFDTLFGSYLEDIDLSLRLKKKGWKNIVVPDVRIVHYGQQTSKKLGVKKQWLDFKNWILVIAKNWTLSDLIRYFPHIIIERLRNLSGIIKSLS